MGRMPRQSPSKITTHRRCNRLTYFEQVLGLYRPSTPAQAFGTEVHRLSLDEYLVKGIMPTESVFGTRALDCAAVAISHFPPPKIPKEQVEQEIWIDLSHFSKTEDALIKGFIDLNEIWRVTDLKTTSDLKYCKTEDELREDAQSVLYSFKAISDTGRSEIGFRHVVVKTKRTHYSKEIEIKWTYNDLASAFSKIVKEDIPSIRKALQASDVSEIEASPESCEDYGGCVHRTTCWAFGLIDQGSGMIDFRQFKKKGADAPAATPKPDPTPAPPINPPMDAETKAHSEQAHEDVKKKHAAKPECLSWTKEACVLWLEKEDPAIFALKKPSKHRVAALRARIASIQDGSVTPATVADPVTTEPETKPEYRPSPEAQGVIEQGVFDLYIDCQPLEGEITYLDQLLEPLMQIVCESITEKERREIPAAYLTPEGHLIHYGMVPYNNGPARVAALLMANRKSLTGRIVALGTLPVTKACVEVLLPAARNKTKKIY